MSDEETYTCNSCSEEFNESDMVISQWYHHCEDCYMADQPDEPLIEDLRWSEDDGDYLGGSYL